MTRPAPITAADLNRYPHLGKTIQAAEQSAPAPEAAGPQVPAAERASITIAVPRIGMPRFMDPDRMEGWIYGFMIGVVFIGLLGVI